LPRRAAVRVHLRVSAGADDQLSGRGPARPAGVGCGGGLAGGRAALRRPGAPGLARLAGALHQRQLVTFNNPGFWRATGRVLASQTSDLSYETAGQIRTGRSGVRSDESL